MVKRTCEIDFNDNESGENKNGSKKNKMQQESVPSTEKLKFHSYNRSLSL